MGEIKLAIHIENGRIITKLTNDKCNLQDLSLMTSTLLLIVKDQTTKFEALMKAGNQNGTS